MADGIAPATKASSRHRLRVIWAAWAPIAIVVAIGLTITMIAFLTVRREEERRVVKTLDFHVDWRAKDLRAKINLTAQPLVGTATDVATEPRIEAEKFSQFTSAVAAQSKSIASIAWAQPVMGGQRRVFEAVTGLPILENSADGKRIPAAERKSYTPIVLQTRFDGRPQSLGLDLSMEPIRRHALEMARDTGLPRSVVVPEASSSAGPTYLVFWPTFNTGTIPKTVDERRAQLRGYAVGVFRVVDVLSAAIADTPAIPEGINFYLSSDTDEGPADTSFRLVAIYSSSDNAVRAAPTLAPAQPQSPEYTLTKSFEVNGQRWRLESFFSSAAVAAERSIGPLTLLIAGLLLTAVLAFNMATQIRQVSVVQTLVDERTADLRKTNTQLEALIEASPYAIVCIDAERRVILWNASAEQLFGYAAEEVIGRPYPLVLPEEQEEFDDRLKRLAAGEVLRNLASHRRHRDGTAIDTSSSASAFYDTAGRLLGIIFAIEDSRERNEIQNQLRQAQKMEAIGQLTGGLAHDFNNLLGIILGNLDLLAERFDGGGEERDLTEAAIQAAMRGAELIRQLLAFSRRQPLAPKLTNLPPVLEGIAKMLRRSLGENIRLELQVAAVTWPVLIDVSQLESTMLNLSVNARDAMPDGGRLTIEASNVVIDERAFVLNLEATPGDYVLIAVSDTGIGMSADVLAHVFEPFFSTKGKQGTGLGLSMVHGFIKQSGGYSKIYSEPGRGTTMRLYLPRAFDGELSEPDTLQIETLPRGHEVILVVEDNEGMRDLAVQQLQSLGYRTLPTPDGAGALEIIQDGVPIDLLFTDVVMPGELDGRALANAARRLRPGLKILFTSGFTAAAASAATEDRFGSNLLSKPYRKSELARRIRAVLDTSD